MTLNLVINYFKSPNPKRCKEYNNCLLQNLRNKHFCKIHIFTKDPNIIWFKSEKIKIIGKHDRPTFSKLMEYSNSLKGYVIIANLDILFDDTVKFIPKIVDDNTCVALTRYDDKIGKWKLWDRIDSQDSWIFKIPIKKIKAKFCLGQRGCDNVLASKLKDKYRIRNPAGTIISRHMHKSGYRNYNLPMVPGGRTHVAIDKKRRYV